MNIQKWNHKVRKYEPYSVPEGLRVTTYCADMGEIINCAQCFKAIRFGNSYTSREIHTHIGMGYAVCEECYDEEWNRENKCRS